ncbi:MAG TPA: PH domain-containing protein [Anaerolineales bacterium]|nr:PH domain-containing protein [Anaerolineales bacterium]
MNNPKVGHFPPAKRIGITVHVIFIIALAATSAWGFWNLSRAQVGPSYVTFLLISLLAFAPIPFFGYRAYALLRADYYIDRDSLAAIWGLRVEDIPLTDIEWVRPASDLTRPLLLPHFRLPGAVLGTRRHPDLGLVEFIASDPKNLILIATSKRVFAISPESPAALAQTFARAIELGSLTPAEPVSVYPSFIITQAWETPLARFLWTSGLFLNLGLVVWVGILIPSLSQIPFGFNVLGVPDEVTASSQLILLPLISGFMYVAGIIAGLYFYRWQPQRPLAFIVWVSGTLCAVLFLLAVLFLVTTPV